MNKVNTLAVLKHVKTLLALERYGSINRAAEALGITQSALTKALQRAESELEHTLFLRHPKGVAPTAAGKIVIKHAKVIHNHSVEAITGIARLGNAPGVLHVGAAASFIDTVLPRALGRVVNQFPSIEISVTSDSVEALIAKLRDAELDLLFISEPPGVEVMQDIKWTPLMSDEMNIVARLDHPLARKSRISLADLAPFSWVLGGRNDPQRSYLESVFSAHGMVPPTVTIECLSRNLSVRLVHYSDLLTLVPNAESNEVFQDLLCIDCQDLHWIRTAGVAAREGVKLPIGGSVLVREVKKTFRDRGRSS